MRRFWNWWCGGIHDSPAAAAAEPPPERDDEELYSPWLLRLKPEPGEKIFFRCRRRPSNAEIEAVRKDLKEIGETWGVQIIILPDWID